MSYPVPVYTYVLHTVFLPFCLLPSYDDVYMLIFTQYKYIHHKHTHTLIQGTYIVLVLTKIGWPKNAGTFSSISECVLMKFNVGSGSVRESLWQEPGRGSGTCNGKDYVYRITASYAYVCSCKCKSWCAVFHVDVADDDIAVFGEVLVLLHFTISIYCQTPQPLKNDGKYIVMQKWIANKEVFFLWCQHI